MWLVAQRTVIRQHPRTLIPPRSPWKSFSNISLLQLEDRTSRSHPQLRVGDAIVSTSFRGTSTRGFAVEGEPGVAVCLLPGTELAFDRDIKYDRNWISTRSAGTQVARFCAVELNRQHQHHDALMFPDGNTVLVTLLLEGSARGCCSCRLRFRSVTPTIRQKRLCPNCPRKSLSRFLQLKIRVRAARQIKPAGMNRRVSRCRQI